MLKKNLDERSIEKTKGSGTPTRKETVGWGGTEHAVGKCHSKTYNARRSEINPEAEKRV